MSTLREEKVKDLAELNKMQSAGPAPVFFPKVSATRDDVINETVSRLCALAGEDGFHGYRSEVWSAVAHAYDAAHPPVAAELRLAQLQAAASVLLEKCDEADEDGELPECIDGSVLDLVRGALAPAAAPAPAPAAKDPDKPPFGFWPAGDIRRIFVDGAKWWEWHKEGATMWQSDQNDAGVEAEKRYPGGRFLTPTEPPAAAPGKHYICKGCGERDIPEGALMIDDSTLHISYDKHVFGDWCGPVVEEETK